MRTANKKFFKMHDKFAVVEFLDYGLRIYSSHPNLQDAADEAGSMYIFRPCEVMQLSLDENNNAVGVIELTAKQKREIAGWQPAFKTRPEDIVIE